ncbi:MAG TPA: M42 family metallopeptidase [Thermotogota bacterium]|nr:M42 family metallopeptidase [Thermotogota bacterium]HRW91846.1 M42 family metallopeptidase [Thermotogota bacterium]
MKETLQRLTAISAPSGREKPVQQAILQELEGVIDGHRLDPVGNLVVWKEGKGTHPKKILLDGHSDEIGLVITRIDEKGFLRVDPVGGVNPLTLLGTMVRFGDYPGVVAFEGETSEELSKNFKHPSYDILFVDIGATSKEDAENKVQVGQFGTYVSSFWEMGPMWVSKSQDDRVACAIIIEVFRGLKACENTVYGVFSVQEEVGLVGSSVAAFDIHPDIAIAIDVTANSDTPKTFKRMDLQLGKGPTIKIKDRASISDAKIVDLLESTAKQNQIPFQFEVLLFGGTNAAGYQVTGPGIPSGTLSIPCRYVHSPHEMVHQSDVENAIRLLSKVVARSDW